MKIWRGFGSEHSANLVIIGHFETPENAAAAVTALEGATRIAVEDADAGRIVAGQVPHKFSSQMLEYLSKTNISLNHTDVEQLLYECSTKVDGNDLVVTTEEDNVNVFVKMMVERGARVEVYSAHKYPGKYGRPTARRE